MKHSINGSATQSIKTHNQTREPENEDDYMMINLYYKGMSIRDLSDLYHVKYDYVIHTIYSSL